MFLGEITDPVTVTFEEPDFSDGDQATGPGLTANFGTFTCLINSPPFPGGLTLVKRDNQPAIDRGRYAPWGPAGATVPPVPGPGAWQYLDASGLFYFEPSTPARAFGFWGVDLGDWEGQMKLTVTFVDTTTVDFVLPYNLGDNGYAPWNESMTFLGIIFDQDFTRVDFANSEPSWDIFGFDNFIVALAEQLEPPPEPPTVVVPVPPADCVPFMIAGPCPQECPIVVPTQVLSTGTPVMVIPGSSAPVYIWGLSPFAWFTGFGGIMGPGVPSANLIGCFPFEGSYVAPECVITVPSQALSVGSVGPTSVGIPSPLLTCGPAFTVPVTQEQCN
jgi:hypothetical protein